MSRLQRSSLRSLGFALLFVTLIGSLSAGQPAKTDKLRIGVLESMFRGMPKPLALAAAQPFRSLLETQTGFQGDVSAAGDTGYISQQLQDGKIDLAVFHGIDFAWTRAKYQDFRPLMICVNGPIHLRAHVLVTKESPAVDLTDLKGKTVSLPRTNREHCRMFLDRSCTTRNCSAETLFGQIPAPANAEDAIDDVVDGLVQGVIVDGVAVECYKRRKPARFEKLREVAKSEAFPAGVIVFRMGTLDAAKQRRLCDGLLAANQTAYGRQLLTLWRLTGFDRVPDDYELTLEEIVKHYPAPAGLAKR